MKPHAPALRPSRRAGLAALAVLGTAALASGCISLLPDPGEPDVVMDMAADPATPAVRDPLPVSLGVGIPVLTRMHGSQQIVVVGEDGSYAYLGGIRLAANAGTTVQNVVLGTFDRSGAVRGAVRSLTIARPDFELNFDLDRFDVTRPEGRADGAARISGTARLTVSLTGQIIATRRFEASAPARRGKPIEAVRGLEAATRAFARQAHDWTVVQLRARLAQRTAPAAPPAAAPARPASR